MSFCIAPEPGMVISTASNSCVVRQQVLQQGNLSSSHECRKTELTDWWGWSVAPILGAWGIDWLPKHSLESYIWAWSQYIGPGKHISPFQRLLSKGHGNTESRNGERHDMVTASPAGHDPCVQRSFVNPCTECEIWWMCGSSDGCMVPHSSHQIRLPHMHPGQVCEKQDWR